MKITSPVLTDMTAMPTKYTCEGENISPPLDFHDIPEKAQSLVLFLEDKDAEPVPWVHWHVYNIPPTTKKVAEGTIPEGGVEGWANNKSFGYEGPCPKYFAGIHHYTFRLLALDRTLDVQKESDKEIVLLAAQKHIIDQAELVVTKEGRK